MGTSYNSSIVTDGLVLCLDAANPRSYPGSGTSWLDLSGNSNNGTLTNGPTFSSDNAGGIVFDGTNDYAKTTLSSSLGSEFTLECFGKFNNATNTAYEYFGSVGEWQPPSRVFLGIARMASNFSTTEKRNKLYVFGTDNVFNMPLDTADWLHITITTSNSAPWVKAYKNGVEHDILTYNLGGTFNVGATVMTGVYKLSSSETYGWYLDGKVAQQRVYNRALSADEVRRNYNATRGRYGN